MLHRRPLYATLLLLFATLLLLVTTAFAAPVFAQERVFTTEIALDVKTPQVAAMTDDGSHVVITVRDRRARRGPVGVDHQRFGDPTYVAPSLVSAMVLDVASGERVWLHEDPAQVGDFTWSPDGEELAYLLYSGDSFSLRVFSVAEGDSRVVSLSANKDIASSSPLVWTPDGESILLTLRPDGWEARASSAFYDLTDAAVIVQDSRNDFLAWDRVRNIANEQTTALVSVEDGSVREILVDVVPQNIGFSPDGDHLTYSVATRTKTTYTRKDGTDYSLYTLDLHGGDGPVALVEPSEDRVSVEWNDERDAYAFAKDGAVFVREIGDDEASDVSERHREIPGDTAKVNFSVDRWSPDGKSLLVTSEEGWHILDADGGALRTIFTLEEEEDERPRRAIIHWSTQGDLFYTYSALDHWERGLRRIDIASGQTETVVLDAALYRGWRISDDGSTVVYTRSDGDRPDDVWVARDAFANTTQLTDLNPQLLDVALARTELVEYLDVDGNTLYGILYYPPNYDPSQKYPLVAEIYERFFDNGFNENMNLVTAQGWFGFRPSVQFEEGYPGEAWLKAVPSAINQLIARGLVEEDQLGVYGQSYGGYAANLLITQTNRFAAAANVSGKVNMVSFLGDSPKITTRNYAAAEVGQDRLGASLWEQPQKYIDHSAVMFADRIETPLLMLSGEGDWNVPATNQREMYYAMRRLEKEVVWVHYTAGGHGAGRASSVADFHDHWARLLAWFDEHFDPDAAAPVSDY